jgi:MFS family permease
VSVASQPLPRADARPSVGWMPIAVLASAQFVMVLDSSVMNVSISQIVADLDTTIEGVQLAITAYTLVMASLMLLGARLGDILGRDRCFAIGLAIYGLGSLTTAVSPNLTVLLIGWSTVEGIGAALVIPAIVSLIAGLYDGKQRALAFGIVGGTAGAAIAAGPLIGGWVTTEFSWRYVFAGETVVVILILLLRSHLRGTPAAQRRPRLDIVGVLLSATGLGLAVFGILKSSEWGWVEPRGALTIGGQEITPFGFSAVPFFILAGVALLAAFSEWEHRRERLGQDTLLDLALLRIVPLKAGLTTLLMQQLILLGTFFVLPVYLQVVLGLDAFDTGKRLFPMSVTMFVAALAGPRLAAGFAPKRVAQAGLLALVCGALLLLQTIDVELNGTSFAIALALFGVGAGLLLSQLGNIIMSSVDPRQANEAGGLQGTAQNLGVARHGVHRVGAHRRADHGLRDARGGQLLDLVARPTAGHRRGAEGHPRRAPGRRRAGPPRRRRPAAPGAGDHRRLRRRPARGAQARDGRRGAVRDPVAVVHAPPAGQAAARRPRRARPVTRRAAPRDAARAPETGRGSARRRARGTTDVRGLHGDLG